MYCIYRLWLFPTHNRVSFIHQFVTIVPVKMVERVLRSPVKTPINVTVRIHSQEKIVGMLSVSIIIKFTFETRYYQEEIRGQRGRLQVQALGYVNSTKVIFGDISRTEVCFPSRKNNLFSVSSALRLTSIGCSERTQ